MSGKGPKAIVANKVVQEVNGETLVYDTRSHRAYCLNEVSSLVWKKCDGKTASAELSKMLSAELNSDVPDELVWLALDQLSDADLVERGDEAPAVMRSISRREVIRRVGLASAVALPVVASLWPLRPLPRSHASRPMHLVRPVASAVATVAEAVKTDVSRAAVPAFRKRHATNAGL